MEGGSALARVQPVKILFAHTSARKRSLSGHIKLDFHNKDSRAKTAKMEFYGGFAKDTKMDVLRAQTQFSSFFSGETELAHFSPSLRSGRFLAVLKRCRRNL